MGMRRTARNSGSGSCGQDSHQSRQQAFQRVGRAGHAHPSRESSCTPFWITGHKYQLVRSTGGLWSPIGKVHIHSPEDLTLYKLMYFGLSQQSKHSRDIAAILKAKKNALDMDYTEQWAARLGLSSLWKEMLDSVS